MANNNRVPQSASPGVKLLFVSTAASRRVQAKLQLPPRLSLLHSLSPVFFFFFLTLFLQPSLFHWLLTGSRNFTQYVDSRRRGAVRSEADPGRLVSAPPTNGCPVSS